MQRFINNWSSALTAPATASAGQLSIDPAQAAKLVGLGAGKFYELTLAEVDNAGAETDWEIVTVTAVTGGTLMLAARSGREWPQGATIQARLTSAAITRMLDDIQALKLRVTALEPSSGIILTSDSNGFFLSSEPGYGSLQPPHASAVPNGEPVDGAYGEVISLTWDSQPGSEAVWITIIDASSAGAPFARMVIDSVDYLVSAADYMDSDGDETTLYWYVTTNPLSAGVHTVEFF